MISRTFASEHSMIKNSRSYSLFLWNPQESLGFKQGPRALLVSFWSKVYGPRGRGYFFMNGMPFIIGPRRFICFITFFIVKYWFTSSRTSLSDRPEPLAILFALELSTRRGSSTSFLVIDWIMTRQAFIFSSSTRSPVPMNLTFGPVATTAERAPPPLADPSIFVSKTEPIGVASWNALAW